MDLESHKEKFNNKYRENKKFFKRLKKLKNKDLDAAIHPIHDAVFENFNCLGCANCCKTTGPLFTDKDILRIAKYFSMRPSEFTDQYLQVDEDGDYVLKIVPCIFLADNNYCSIYNVRPKACKEFPHTDRIRQSQLLKLTQKNIEVCPAVFEIIEKLKKQLVK